MKNIRKTHRNQEKRREKNILFWRLAEPIPSQEVRDSLCTTLHNLPYSIRQALNSLLYLQSKYRNVFVSQERIARHTGFSRPTINKAVSILEKLGLIAVYYRPFKTCLYKVASFFYNPHIQVQLSKLLPVFALTISMLLCSKPALDRKYGYGLTLLLVMVYEYLSTKDNYDKKRAMVNPEGAVGAPRGPGSGMVKYRKLSKKEMIMEHVLSPVAKEAGRYLGATSYGTLKLTAYPDEVLLYALSQVKNNTTIRDRYRYFMSVADRYCKLKQLPSNWSAVLAISAKLNLDDTTPVVKSDSVAPSTNHTDLPVVAPFSDEAAPAARRLSTTDALARSQERIRQKNESERALLTPEQKSRRDKVGAEYLTLFGIPTPLLDALQPTTTPPESAGLSSTPLNDLDILPDNFYEEVSQNHHLGSDWEEVF